LKSLQYSYFDVQSVDVLGFVRDAVLLSCVKLCVILGEMGTLYFLWLQKYDKWKTVRRLPVPCSSVKAGISEGIHYDYVRVSCTMCTGSFPGGKERPGRDADPSPPSSGSVKKQWSYTSTPPMGRTACTEPQCLYSRAIPLLPL